MASASITVRTAKAGRRFIVRYRLGGRAYPLLHGGSFKTMREAKARRDLIAGELAAGRNPADLLRAMVERPQTVTLSNWFERFIESRIDVGKSAIALYGNARDRLGKLADRDPSTLRPSDIQEWIAENKALAPRTVRHYLGSLRQVLDFAEVQPNPARAPSVKAPRIARAEVRPPSRDEWDAILGKLAPKAVLPSRLMECCGLRVSETIQLTFGDVDFAGGRIRISEARTKGGTAGQRWLPVPDELLDEMDALVPLEDRHHERRVFPYPANWIRDAMTRACKLAKIAHYHPHDLRHRRCSLWVVTHGFNPVTVKGWSGHSNATMLIDTYSHVMINPADEWADFWKRVYGSPGVAPVWSGEGESE